MLMSDLSDLIDAGDLSNLNDLSDLGDLSGLVVFSGVRCEVLQTRGVTRGTRERNSPGAESLWGLQITLGGAE